MEASQFKSLFLPCHHKLYAVAWRLTGNSQAAEDLVQETYLRLWTKRHQIADIENAEAYSISVLRRQFYDVKGPIAYKRRHWTSLKWQSEHQRKSTSG